VLYDAIVVGAGPAGNLAALRLAEAGHRVCVVDWRQNIGDKLCTGIIGRECMARYPADPADIYRAAQSAVLVSPSGKRFRLAKSRPQAYIVNRVSFVASIAAQAQQAGAAYLLGPKVTGIEVGTNDVSLQTEHEGRREVLHGRLLILASGFASPLIRMAGLNGGGHGDAMISSQVEVETAGVEETEVYLGNAVAPGSFGWLVPLAGSRAHVGIATRKKLNGHLPEFLTSLQKAGKVRGAIKKPQNWGIPVKPLPKTYAARVLVAGDAAGLAKPTTGGGIYYALLSGEIAAKTAGGAIATGDFSARRLKEYERGWKAVLGRELRIGYLARVLYEVLGDRQIDSLLDSILTKDVQGDLLASEDFSFDWHSVLIKKAVNHRVAGRVIASFGSGSAPLMAHAAPVRGDEPVKPLVSQP
jgi:geranylgeranyl reductase family protein